MTAAVNAALEDALRSRELLKVRVLESAPVNAREAAARMEAAVGGTHVIQVIGRTVVLYRPFPEEPEIRLPG